MKIIEELKLKNFLEKKSVGTIGKIPLLNIEVKQWLAAVTIVKQHNYRFAGIWANDLLKQLQITACFALPHEYILLRAQLDPTAPQLSSITSCYYAANRFERHIRDLLGIEFIGIDDARSWTRHQAWQSDNFPLRRNFPLAGMNFEPTPADSNYTFLHATNPELYEIPVGPVHAGIIEPGHFRFLAAGEDIVYMEERLGYVHKGIEKLGENHDCNSILTLAARISGDCAVGHAWAAAQALENAAACTIPLRAAYLRGILAERERIINHLWDLAAICNDVGFAFDYYQFGRLRENWLQTNATIYQHRLLFDTIIPGGVKHDLTKQQILAMLADIKALKTELTELSIISQENMSLQNRLRTTGILTPTIASEVGALGYVARASDVDFDVRRDFSYLPYSDFNITVPVLSTGDVAARASIRVQEILVALQLLSEFLVKLPPGENVIEFKPPTSDSEGVGIIESWRGEIITYLSVSSKQKILRFFPRDPSWFNWLALEKLLYHDIVPDFPVCNKSINGSYSGSDL